jgi:c-di-GMP-binding flagellar brake protein YcgR
MESRYSIRIPVEGSVVFAGEAVIGEGRVIDVSLPGCLMESLESAKPGDYVQLKLFLPDQPPAISVPLAVVRWAEGNRVGVEFIRASEDDQTRLTRFVQRRQRGAAAPQWEGGVEILSAAGD